MEPIAIPPGCVFCWNGYRFSVTAGNCSKLSGQLEGNTVTKQMYGCWGHPARRGGIMNSLPALDREFEKVPVV